ACDFQAVGGRAPRPDQGHRILVRQGQEPLQAAGHMKDRRGGWEVAEAGWISILAPANRRQAAGEGPGVRAPFVQLAQHGPAVSSAHRLDQLLVVQLKYFLDPGALAVQMTSQPAEQPRPSQTALAGPAAHAAIASS